MILIDDLTKLYDFQGGDPVTLRQHALMELHECVHSYVIEASFYDISQLRHIYLDHALIIALVEQWRCETHTFHLRVCEITPTL
jgi:hypothetical protein